MAIGAIKTFRLRLEIFQMPTQMPVQNQIMIPEEYKPISAWGYVGYSLLFSIPCVGIILMFVWAFGNGTNINLKNYAKSYLLMLLISIIVSVVLVIIFGAIGVSIFNDILNQ